MAYSNAQYHVHAVIGESSPNIHEILPNMAMMLYPHQFQDLVVSIV